MAEYDLQLKFRRTMTLLFYWFGLSVFFVVRGETRLNSDYVSTMSRGSNTPNFGITESLIDDGHTAAGKCDLTVQKNSAQYFKYEIETWNPNFANLYLSFVDNYPVNRTKDIILPMQWFWTYYSPDGYFPYLKWPVDFSILSLGLLNARTLPITIYINLEVHTPNCSIVMGQRSTTVAIAKALKKMTEKYLMTINPRSYSYSYYCFLAERPGERDTLDYFLGVYIGFPSDFEGYNCCRTDIEKTKKSDNLRISCLNYQIKKMYQCTVIPFIISLIVFAYFPIFLISISSDMVKLDTNIVDNTPDEEWVYLSGRSPLTFTAMLCGLCGLSKKYPIFVSRLRRLLFMLISPCVIYIQLIVYRDNNLVKSFIHHGSPMAYLSMLGGFEKSKTLFIPVLGGPYILLVMFYVGSFVFIVLPKSLNNIMENGISKAVNPYTNELNLLALSDEKVEKLSAIPVCKHHGYARLSNRCKAGFFMVLNTDFWRYAMGVQIERFMVLRRFIQVRSGRKKALISVTLIPFLLTIYVVGSILEILLSICLYGIPLFSFIKYVVTSYMKSIMAMFHCGNEAEDSDRTRSVLCKFQKPIRTTLTVFIGLVFVYFTFSFCTIFCASLSFLARIMVFSLLAVIVYPAFSFGYLFFGLAFFYYFCKLLQGFGEVYFELLLDAVEISDRLDACASGNNQETEDNIAVTQTKKLRYRNYKMGIPRDLFDLLVRKYRPVHVHVVKSLMRLFLILSLIIVTISVVLGGSYQQKAAISEVIHVIFIVAIGALPRILELAVSTMNESVKKDIEIRKMTEFIEQYWRDREFVVIN